MNRIESSVLIDAGIEDVFSYAADWRRWEECWIPFSWTLNGKILLNNPYGI